MSPASFATSVPPPIAKPTSAFLSAGASLIPSPVIPATSPASWASLTSRLLSVGSARATTRSCGSRCRSCSSVSRFSSPLVSTAPAALSSGSSPTSRAIAAAVSRLSPVIITTCTPAPCTCRIAAAASERTSSRIPTNPMKMRSGNGEAAVTGRSDRQSSSTRIAWLVSCCNCCSSGNRRVSGRTAPEASRYRVQAGSSFSGAPLR